MSKSIKILIILLFGVMSKTCFAQISESGAYSIAAGDSGQSYIAGFSGTTTESNMCIAKYDLNGDTLWTRLFGGGIGNVENKAYAITIDKQWNIIVTGYITTVTGPHIATLKYDPQGNMLWSQIFVGTGNSGDKAYAITLDSYNNIYITGYTTSVNNGKDYVTIKYDPNGDSLWVKTYDGPGHSDDIATSIVMAGDNHVVVTGSSRNSSNSGSEDIATIEYNTSDGSTAWGVQRYNGSGNAEDKGNAVIADLSGNIYVTGYSTGYNSRINLTTISYNSTGTETWIAIDSTGLINRGNSISISPNNNTVFVTGTTSSSILETTVNYLTECYNSSDGSLAWNKTYASSTNGTDVAHKIAVSPADNSIYVTGSSRIDSSRGPDMFTVKYDITSGNLVDSSRFNTGPNTANVAYDVVVDSQSNVFIAGYTAPFGGNHFSNTVSKIQTVKFSKGSLGNKKTKVNNVSLPKSFKLYQNYPNPFNPSTIIKFEIAQRVNVKLIVYDILGREVQTLVDNTMEAGSYAVPFNKPGLSSGIYFYSLTAGNFRDIKKMVIIK
jgi:hypothetical protein